MFLLLMTIKVLVTLSLTLKPWPSQRWHLLLPSAPTGELAEDGAISNTAHCTKYTAHCTQYTAYYSLCSTYFTLHTVHLSLETEHFTLHKAHCILHTEHCTLHTCCFFFIFVPKMPFLQSPNLTLFH